MRYILGTPEPIIYKGVTSDKELMNEFNEQLKQVFGEKLKECVYLKVCDTCKQPRSCEQRLTNEELIQQAGYLK